MMNYHQSVLSNEQTKTIDSFSWDFTFYRYLGAKHALSHYKRNGGEEAGYGIVMLADSTTITVGYTKSGNEPHLVMMRLAQNGTQMWAKTLSGVSLGRDIYQTSDGNFVICGSITENSNSDILILKIDEDGNILWSKKYGGATTEQGNAIMEIAKDDGSFQYAITGYTSSLGQQKDGFLLLLEDNGSFISSHVYQTAQDDIFSDLNHDHDQNRIILSGETNQDGTRDAFVVLLNEDGTFQNAAAYDGGGDDWFNAAEKGFYTTSSSSFNYYWLGGASDEAQTGKQICSGLE